MTDRIVNDNRVQKALDFLVSSAAHIGEATERHKNAENKVKHVEALMFKMSDATSNDKRQADARTSEEWLKATAEEAEAYGEVRALYARREAESAIIEAWRSESATYRAMRI